MGPQRQRATDMELRQIDDVRNNLRFQTELPENIDQIPGGTTSSSAPLKHAARYRRPLQMIAGLATSIVDQSFLASQVATTPRGKRRQQKRRIRG